MAATYGEQTLTSRDGTSLFLRTWAGDAPAGELLFVLHGYGEHSGRYDHVARHFAALGYNVAALDLRGHGKSGGQRGHVNAFSEWLDDTDAGLSAARKTYSQARSVTVVAHSMGGLVALRHLLERPGAFNRYVVSAPFFGVAMPVPAWKSTLGKLMSRIYPGLSMPSGIPAEFVSHDPEIVAKYNSDELNHHVATARFYTEALASAAWVTDNLGKLATPGLWLVAGEDNVSDSRLMKAAHARITASTPRLIEYPGFYHEMFNEPPADRARVFADVLAFLKSM